MRSRFSHLERLYFALKRLQTKIQKYRLFSSKNISFIEVQKSLMKKVLKEDEQSLTDLSSVHRRSRGKCQLAQTSYINRIKLFLFVI